MRFGGPKRSGVGAKTVVRTLAILAAVGLCLVGAAYAATRRAGGGDESARIPLQPRLLVHPDAVTSEKVAEFDFAQPARPSGKIRAGAPLVYECHLDDGAWEVCEGPLSLTGITLGAHRFAVRAVNHSGTEGPAESFNWRRTRMPKPEASASQYPAASPAVSAPPADPPATSPVEPIVEPVVEPPVEPPATGLPFTIEQVGALADLYPGAPAQTIGVRVDNPNPVAISVVSLTAAIAVDPPGCPAADNFALTPAGTSIATPLLVPAESTATPGSAGIPGPTIAMIEQPWSQDACQGAELQIALSGEATG
jgi:hypothetical protein